jgi:hypothetical protein
MQVSFIVVIMQFLETTENCRALTVCMELYSRPRSIENYFVPVYRVYSVSSANILTQRCELLYISEKRHFTIKYLNYFVSVYHVYSATSANILT